MSLLSCVWVCEELSGTEWNDMRSEAQNPDLLLQYVAGTAKNYIDWTVPCQIKLNRNWPANTNVKLEVSAQVNQLWCFYYSVCMCRAPARSLMSRSSPNHCLAWHSASVYISTTCTDVIGESLCYIEQWAVHKQSWFDFSQWLNVEIIVY